MKCNDLYNKYTYKYNFQLKYLCRYFAVERKYIFSVLILLTMDIYERKKKNFLIFKL